MISARVVLPSQYSGATIRIDQRAVVIAESNPLLPLIEVPPGEGARNVEVLVDGEVVCQKAVRIRPKMRPINPCSK